MTVGPDGVGTEILTFAKQLMFEVRFLPEEAEFLALGDMGDAVEIT